MTNMDGPLDFETEDPLLGPPVIVKKRKNVIGLDDLLTDYYEEKSKVVERDSKWAKARKNYNSDEDDDGKETLLSETINMCHNQMKEMGGEEEICMWGIEVFGEQKATPPLAFPDIRSCSLLQSFLSNELNSLVKITTATAEPFLEGLLVNGWLSNLVSTHGHLEKSLAKWTFNLMLYSPKEELRASACDFWCTILSTANKNEKLAIRFGCLPNYSELKRALETYGFFFNFSSHMESINTGSGDRGPPKNVRAWVKFAAACCHVRSKQPIFSASEAEELVEVAIILSLDRSFQGLLVLFYEFMQVAISYFKDEEWNNSCEKIARSLASRVPRDLNCLRIVEFISGVGTHFNHFRSAVSYHILVICFHNKATSEEEILNLLMSVNVKDKNCDLFKLYIYLVLTENWILSNPMLEEKPVVYEMWGVFLCNCCCQIASTDLRPCASKVRTKASYILHRSTKK